MQHSLNRGCPLTVAKSLVEVGSVEMVRLLLEAGASAVQTVDIVDSRTGTSEGSSECLRGIQLPSEVEVVGLLERATSSDEGREVAVSAPRVRQR